MVNLWIEMTCPEHGLERFKIKIIKRFNMKPDTIMPKFRSRPTVDDLSCLLVGRDVGYDEIEHFVTDYFRRKGWMETILRMKLV